MFNVGGLDVRKGLPVLLRAVQRDRAAIDSCHEAG